MPYGAKSMGGGIKMAKRIYETMFVVKPDLSEEMRNQIIQKVKGWLEERIGAEFIEEVRWGLRKLAFRTQNGNYREGDYTYYIYKADPEKIIILEEQFHITQEVMRFQTFRREDLEKKEKKKETNITVEEPVEEEIETPME